MAWVYEEDLTRIEVTRNQLCGLVWKASDVLTAREAALVMAWSAKAPNALSGQYTAPGEVDYECPACAAGLYPPPQGDRDAHRRVTQFAYAFDDAVMTLFPEANDAPDDVLLVVVDSPE